MSAEQRRERTAAADALCASAYAALDGPLTGVALVAVGGFGRGELAPYSDLDVVLVHDEGVDEGPLAEQIWYPLWDAGRKLDHAVRSLDEMVEQAAGDPRVALGLLDIRHLAGDPNLTLRLRTTVLTEWRRTARERLPDLRRLVTGRHQVFGELAHAAVPDLKEAEGGIRDATVLRALVATWLVDMPSVELERSRRALLDVRDHLHALAGRATDRVAPEAWPELAERLGLAPLPDRPDGESAQRHVREIGRRVTHLSRLTWRRVDRVLAEPSARGRGTDRRPRLEPIAPGLAVTAGEVVLEAGARPDQDPTLLLRAAAEAAERDLVLNPSTAARLVREGADLPDPWPEAARQLFVRLLAAGPGLLEVWQTLDETGAVERLLPEWERIRLLPHATQVHRFTVDRHSVETCIESAALIREVSRPDVLVVAALLHDIGKGGRVAHSVAGEPIARAVARRLGFGDLDVGRVGTLVRWHLLLGELATSRDPEDPATIDALVERIDDLETLSLLTALTEADAKATSPKAWTSWRAALVKDLVGRAAGRLAGSPSPSYAEPSVLPGVPAVPPAEAEFSVTAGAEGARITVAAADRVGLLADVAAALAIARIPVRGARAWDQDGVAVSTWLVAEPAVDARLIRQRYAAVHEGRVDAEARLGRVAEGLDAVVLLHPEASDRSTVLEVRAADRPGVLYLVCAALARIGVSVKSAHVDTLGPQAVDVFYLQEEGAGALSEVRAAQAAHAVRVALGG